MGRREESGPIPGLLEDRSDDVSHGAFAVGSGDMDGEEVPLGVSDVAAECGDSLQSRFVSRSALGFEGGQRLEQQDVFGHAAQIVSVSGVEGRFAVEGHLRREDAALLPTEGLPDLARRGYESRLTGVCRAGDGSAVFDGAQAGDREEVLVSGCVSPPSVVRDDGHELGAAAHEVAVEVAVESFVADGRTDGRAVMGECRSVETLSDLSDDASEVDDEEFQHLEYPRRGVLHADHQPSLVMELHAACGVEPHGGVEDVVIPSAESVGTGCFGLCPGSAASPQGYSARAGSR